MLGDTLQKYLIKKNEATAHRGELEKGESVRMHADTQAGISRLKSRWSSEWVAQALEVESVASSWGTVKEKPGN